jgi:hypothetical protein
MPTVAAVVILNMFSNDELLQAILQSRPNHLVLYKNKKIKKNCTENGILKCKKKNTRTENPSDRLKHTQS